MNLRKYVEAYREGRMSLQRQQDELLIRESKTLGVVKERVREGPERNLHLSQAPEGSLGRVCYRTGRVIEFIVQLL